MPNDANRPCFSCFFAISGRPRYFSAVFYQMLPKQGKGTYRDAPSEQVQLSGKAVTQNEFRPKYTGSLHPRRLHPPPAPPATDGKPPTRKPVLPVLLHPRTLIPLFVFPKATRDCTCVRHKTQYPIWSEIAFLLHFLFRPYGMSVVPIPIRLVTVRTNLLFL